MKQVGYFLQYILLLPLVLFAKFLTVSQRKRFASMCGIVVCYIFLSFRFLFKKRYNIFAKNLAIISGKKIPEMELNQRLKEYFIYASVLFLQSFAFNKKDKIWIKQNIIFEKTMVEKILKLYNDGEKIIIASIHIGNWELVHHYLTDVLNLKVALIYRKQNNEYFESFIANARTNSQTIDKKNKNALKKIINAFEEKRIVMVLLDQRDIPHGEEISVCGYNAKIPTSLIKYGIKNGCHIICGTSFYEKERLSVKCKHFTKEEIQNNTAKEITQKMFDIFSNAIKTHTMQWYCLMHDLWKK